MTPRLLLAAALLAIPAPASAQPPAPIDADRPHVGTGTHIVPVGQVQFEIGGQLQRFDTRQSYASPALMRIGISDRVEARVSSDGLLVQSADGERVSGVGNTQVGAKVRLAGARGEPWLSVLPAITIGTASREKGFGSGETDATLTILAGAPVGPRAHVEANYGIGNLGDAGGDRFAQHLISAAITHATTPALTTYVEGAWWSRQAAAGDPISFIDYGAIYALTPRLLVDGGAFTGVTAATADYGVFAGVSFVIGRARTSNTASAARAASGASPTRARR